MTATANPPSDEHLLARFARGDDAALATLAQRHERALVGLAAALLDGQTDRAHDAVQEAWVKVIKHARGFRGDSTFRTWMYRIVINKCKDIRERHGSVALTDDLAHTTDTSPLRLVSDHALTHDVRIAMRTLPAQTRLLLIICYHQGLSHPQAADVLDIPVGTLKSRLAAALTELRGLLHAHHTDHKKAVTP